MWNRALRLGAARNACLSRAADAWRRGDGAAAERFSREGHDLNAKMAVEMVEAAGKLVRERARLAEQAVRSRDVSWSDDPGDRSARGRLCGTGLGVFLGIASSSTGGDTKLTPEERTEALLDLHGLIQARMFRWRLVSNYGTSIWQNVHCILRGLALHRSQMRSRRP